MNPRWVNVFIGIVLAVTVGSLIAIGIDLENSLPSQINCMVYEKVIDCKPSNNSKIEVEILQCSDDGYCRLGNDYRGEVINAANRPPITKSVIVPKGYYFVSMRPGYSIAYNYEEEPE